MRRIFCFLVLSLFSVLAAASDELQQRRAKLADTMGENALLVLFPAPQKTRSNDVKWPYRQDNNLYYLTNDPNQNSHLVLLKNNGKLEEYIFTKLADPKFEIWEGKLPTANSLQEQTGVQEIFELNKFDDFIHSLLLGTVMDKRREARLDTPRHLNFYQQVLMGNVEVWLDLGRKRNLNDSAPLSAAQEFARQLRDNFPEIKIRNITPTLRVMREVKSASELALMQAGVDLTEKAHLAAMQAVQTASREYEIQAKVEEVFRNGGGCCWSYPSIAGSGANATILHYTANNETLQKGNLFLLDAGAEYQHYATDITRTFPISGKFSKDQKAIYELVLRAQRSAIGKARAGESFKTISKISEDILANGLLDLGLITEKTNEQLYSYNLHGLGHSVGLDVHDALELHHKFKKGMVITVEPGIYIRKKDVIEKPWFKALSKKAQTKIIKNVDKYEGIGVRIEDQVLITDGEPKIMSESLPVTVADIEATMAKLIK